MHSSKFLWLIMGMFPLFAVGLLLTSLQIPKHLSTLANDETVDTGSFMPELTLQSSTSNVDLSVGLVVFPENAVMPAQPVVYSLFITNSSAISVSNIKVTDILPGEIISTSVLSTSNGSSITTLTSAPEYTWEIDNLGPQAKVSIYIVGRINPRQNVDAQIINRAAVIHESDVVTANNESTLALDVAVPLVSFETTEIDLGEEQTALYVNIVLDPTNPYNTTTVDYLTQSPISVASMGNPIDYQDISGTVSFEAAVQRTNGISVTLFEDHVDEGVEYFQIVLENPVGARLSSDSVVTVTVNDDDFAGVAVEPPLLSLSEDGTNSQYTIQLKSQPLAPVELEVHSLPQIIAEPTKLLFTPSSWNVPQIVNTVAADDSVAEGIHPGSINHVSRSLDAKYDGMQVPTVGAGIVDNDRAALLISTANLTVTQGVTDSTTSVYFVSLLSKPTGTVTITMQAEIPLQVVPEQLVFTPDIWSEAQRVFVSVSDSSEPLGQTGFAISHEVESLDVMYAQLASSDVQVLVKNEKRPGVKVMTQTITATVEGSVSYQYSVALHSPPSDEVTVIINSDENLQVTPNEVHFDASNWDQPQNLTISLRDNSGVQGTQESTISLTTQSVDEDYASLDPLNVTVRFVSVNSIIFLPILASN